MAGLVDTKNRIYSALKEGKLNAAEELALEAMEEDISDNDLEVILKIVKFWQNRTDFFEFSQEVNNGELLFREWDAFIDFCVDNKVDNKKAFYAIKAFVFHNMVDLLIESYKLSPFKDREILIILGQAFYEIGMTGKAIETLEYAMSLPSNQKDVRVFTLLGDLYSQSGDTDRAMLMYSEAFFYFPQLVDVKNCDFPSIRKLYETVKKDGFEENEIVEWIPIYGYLYGGLTSRRKLEYQDYMELVRRIKEYEKSLEIDKKVVNVIIPRLVNYYIWTFDYYMYQVKAVNGGRKVSKRILELLGACPGPEKAMEKIRSRADVLFRELLSRSWNVGVSAG